MVFGVAVARTAFEPAPEDPVEALAESARTAPGVDGLRRAGCDTPLVFDGREALEAFGPLLRGLGGFREDVTVVVCLGAPTQDCDALARRFADRAGPVPDRFFLMASGASGARRADGVAPESLCSGLYAADGARVGP